MKFCFQTKWLPFRFSLLSSKLFHLLCRDRNVHPQFHGNGLKLSKRNHFSEFSPFSWRILEKIVQLWRQAPPTFDGNIYFIRSLWNSTYCTARRYTLSFHFFFAGRGSRGWRNKCEAERRAVKSGQNAKHDIGSAFGVQIPIQMVPPLKVDPQTISFWHAQAIWMAILTIAT